LLLPSLDDLGNPAFPASPNGRQWTLTYQRRQFDSNIWRLDIGKPGQAQKLIASTRVDDSPRYSPDGGRIAFISDRNGHSELWVTDADGRNETALTSFADYRLGSPRWSSDGRHIAFDALKGSGRAIFVVDAAGSAPRRITQWADVGRPSWSADGRSVYFFRQQKSGREIWRVEASADGSAPPVQVTQGGGFEGFESADGRQFYYMRDSRSHELWQMPVAGGEARIVLAKGVSAGWWQLRTDGVAYADMTNPGDNTTVKPVYFYSFRTGDQRRAGHQTPGDQTPGHQTKIGTLSGNLNPDTPDFQVSPDFSHILFSRFDAANSDIEMLLWP
jgi:Tol biopolymer transport system component